MAIRQQVRYDRSGNVVKALSDEVRIELLRLANDRLTHNADATGQSGPSAEQVIEEAFKLTAFFD